MKSRYSFNLKLFKVLFFLISGFIIGFLLQNYLSQNSRLISFVSSTDRIFIDGYKSLETDVSLSKTDKEYLLKSARGVLNNYFLNYKSKEIESFQDAPSNLIYQNPYVFITLIRDGRVRACKGANSGDLLKSVLAATKRAIEDSRFGGTLKKDEVFDINIEISLLSNPKLFYPEDMKDQVNLGIDSLKIVKGEKSAFFKSSVPITHSYSLKHTLERLSKKAGLGNSGYYKDRDVGIYRYSTIQFAGNGIDSKVVDLYRYNILFNYSDVTKNNIVQSLRSCGKYLSNHIDGRGIITYEYDVYKDKMLYSSFNAGVIRGIASIWALAAIGNYFNDQDFISSAKRGIDYYLDDYYIYDEEQGFGYIKVKNGVSIGTAAFALLVLNEIGAGYRDAEKIGLEDFIFAMEDKEKGFLYPVYLPDKYSQFDRKEIYYSGEALTAIMSLYEKTKDEKYLNLTERVFDYYQVLFDRASRRMSMAPWMSKAYGKVYFATKNKKYAEFVFKMNDLVLSYQNGLDIKDVDRIGSFYSKGSACSTGVYVESLAEAYKIAKDLGDRGRMRLYKKAILMGDRFILQSQYRKNNSFIARDVDLALGGIRTTVYKSKIRIDTVQHGANAFLKTLEVLY